MTPYLKYFLARAKSNFPYLIFLDSNQYTGTMITAENRFTKASEIAAPPIKTVSILAGCKTKLRMISGISCFACCIPARKFPCGISVKLRV